MYGQKQKEEWIKFVAIRLKTEQKVKNLILKKYQINYRTYCTTASLSRIAASISLSFIKQNILLAIVESRI